MTGRTRKRRSKEEPGVSGVNIIPVIDVTLVLLVILLLMSPVLNLPNINVDLPQAMTKETKDQNLTVSLGSDGRISVDMDVLLDPSELPKKLMEKLKGRGNEVVVIVRADKSLPYGAVEDLVRNVNRYVGNRAVAIATQQRTQPLETQKSL